VDSTQVCRDDSQGPLLWTENPLDLAVQGEGFLQVELDDGTVAYRRGGTLILDRGGSLSTAEGQPIVPSFRIPSGTTRLTITALGEIRAAAGGENRLLGRIEMARFRNPSGLIQVGSGLFLETPSSGPPLIASPGSGGMGILVQGAVEGSNVDLATEYVMDILSSVEHKANLDSLRTQDQMLGTLLDIKT